MPKIYWIHAGLLTHPGNGVAVEKFCEVMG